MQLRRHQRLARACAASLHAHRLLSVVTATRFTFHSCSPFRKYRRTCERTLLNARVVAGIFKQELVTTEQVPALLEKDELDPICTLCITDQRPHDAATKVHVMLDQTLGMSPRCRSRPPPPPPNTEAACAMLLTSANQEQTVC